MSVRRDRMSWLLIFGTLLVIVGLIVSLIVTQMRPRINVRLGDGIFTARVVTEKEDLDRGLGGVSKLSPNEAMLFVFNNDSLWPIWMKDMKIPLDVVWLDSSKKVVYIVKGAQPSSYPDVKFTPNDKARYVLELAAGTVDSRKIRIGSQSEFELGELKEWWQ